MKYLNKTLDLNENLDFDTEFYDSILEKEFQQKMMIKQKRQFMKGKNETQRPYRADKKENK